MRRVRVGQYGFTGWRSEVRNVLILLRLPGAYFNWVLSD